MAPRPRPFRSIRPFDNRYPAMPRQDQPLGENVCASDELLFVAHRNLDQSVAAVAERQSIVVRVLARGDPTAVGVVIGLDQARLAIGVGPDIAGEGASVSSCNCCESAPITCSVFRKDADRAAPACASYLSMRSNGDPTSTPPPSLDRLNFAIRGTPTQMVDTPHNTTTCHCGVRSGRHVA